MNEPTNAAECVALGASLLDERFPGWHKLINLEKLSIADCTDCICGQLGNNLAGYADPYTQMLVRLGVPPDTHGFDSYALWDEEADESIEFISTYVQLDEEWRKAINVRREMDKLPRVPESAAESRQIPVAV
jgi:hypothetical protein